MLTNPLGLLALLGIPAVLAIHFLQRKSVELPVSTLFLLDRTQRDAVSGRRFDRITPSIPLWMQLLAVLLLTWLLVEPRYPKANTVQRLAIVLDSSASMSVFKNDAISRLLEELPSLQGPASTLEITLLESIPDRPRLYTGASIPGLTRALHDWTPGGGLADPTQSLRLARSLVSREGTVVYLTDTPADTLPFEARLLAVGRPLSNVGFTGVSFSNEQGSPVWKALVRNYGSTPADRTWTLQTSAGSTTPAPVTIPPNGLVTLQAAFPRDAGNVRIALSADDFPLDDTLPIVLPQPKPLTLFASTSPAFAGLTEKLLHSLETATPTRDAASADLTLATYDPLDRSLPPGNAIIFVEDGTSTSSYLRGGLIAEPSPLMDGLNWQSLLIRETIRLDHLPTDQVLLWQEKRPLIFLRRLSASPDRPASAQLLFNFDLRLSNAIQQPAFIVLLHRFAETIRSAKIAPVSANLETNQPLALASHPDLPLDIEITDPSGVLLSQSAIHNPQSAISAPAEPGFLTISQAGSPLLGASVQFADTREADFSACGSSSDLAGSTGSILHRHTQPDPLWQLWLLLLIAALLIAWKFTTPKVQILNLESHPRNPLQSS